MEFLIGCIDVKALAIEQMCFVAPESTIQNCLEEMKGFNAAEEHIPVV